MHQALDAPLPRPRRLLPRRAVGGAGSSSQSASALPGLGLALTVALIAVAVGRVVPAASPLLLAILAGVGLANLAPRLLDGPLAPGLAVASRRLLRLGIVLLGLQVAGRDIVALGWPVLIGVAAVVGGGIAVSVVGGRLLRIDPTQALLIGCGFSICGAAAVAGADGILGDRRKPEQTATAVALVVLFGSALIGLLPLLAGLAGLSPRTAGVWTGASVHEVAQVVAAGGIVGGTALQVAVVVKLARVLLLAPVLAGLSWWQRRSAPAVTGVRRPPLVPLFVAGFLAMVALRTGIALPAAALDVAKLAQTALLAAAMFALGCSVHWSVVRRAGGRVVALAAVATTVVLALGYVTARLAG